MSLVLTQNRNKSLGFVNGQIVTVVNVQSNTLLVRHPEGHIFTVYPVTESTDSGNVTRYPCLPGYATTITKVKGSDAGQGHNMV